jgi:hypothetical protein
VILYVDIDTGELRRSLNGPVFSGLTLYLRDILSLGIAYVQEGALVTNTVLAGSAVQKVGLRAKPTGNLLALASTYTLANSIASTVFSLATQELVDHFANNCGPDQIVADCLMEVDVTAADGTTRRTYFQGGVNVRRAVNVGDDVPVHLVLGGNFIPLPAVTSYALARAIVTAGRPLPTMFLFYIASTWESWTLRAKAGSGEDDDGVSFLEPDDYDADDNDVVLVKDAIN